MIDVKEAVKRACDYFKSLYAGEGISGVLLEEVELAEDERYWLITLSYIPPRHARTSLPALFDTSNRDYKTFKIKADTGEVLSMKIRQIK